MNKLSKLSLAVIAALGLGFSGCGSSSSSSNGTIADDFAVMVSRGDVYGATVTDSASPAHIAVQTEGKNEYKFDIPESAIEFPIKVNGGYVDVNDDGKIEADIDTKLNIEMKSYASIVTPVTTYLADEAEKAKRDEKLQALADLVNENNAEGSADITTADLLKSASEASFDATLAINAVYAELTDIKNNNANTFDLDDVSDMFNKIKNGVDTEASAVDVEKYTIQDLGISKLTTVEVKAYLNDVSAATSTVLDDIKSVSDLQGKTVYTMDLEADPKTYTKIELPNTLSTDSKALDITTYELNADKEWKEVQNSLEAEASLNEAKSELTLVVKEDGKQEVKNVIDSISLDGVALSTDLSVKDLTNALGVNGDFSAEEDGKIYLEMTAEMQSPELI